MLYWRSNTGTTACIDYTNGALDGACYIWWSNTDTTASIGYTNEALDIECYIGRATMEHQHLLIIPTEHWTGHVILAEQHWNNSMS